MEFNHFFDKIAQYDYIYPAEESDPRRKFLSTQGAVMGGTLGFLLRNKIHEALSKDVGHTALSHIFGTPTNVQRAKLKTIYRPAIAEKLLKHSPILSTLGGAAGGALALRTLYNLSE